MGTASNSCAGGYRRTIASAATVVLIAAQLLAAAHFHRSRGITELSAGNTDAVCAVCVVRTHAPAASIATAAPFVPALMSSQGIPALAAGSFAPQVLRLFGRAPPASL